MLAVIDGSGKQPTVKRVDVRRHSDTAGVNNFTRRATDSVDTGTMTYPMNKNHFDFGPL
jgi:hypothetical protein